MIAPQRPDDDFDDDDAPPDSAVQPISVPLSGRSTTVGRMRSSVPPEGVRIARIVVRATEGLRRGYLTVTTVGESKVLFEGELGADGSVDIEFAVPEGTRHVHALLEAGTKYRNANIELVLGDGAKAEYCFS
jgi:hypothetical protein